MAEAVRQVDYFYMEVPNKVGEGKLVGPKRGFLVQGDDHGNSRKP